MCGFGMGEHFAARPKLLSAALQHLPADKPRVAVGLVSDEADAAWSWTLRILSNIGAQLDSASGNCSSSRQCIMCQAVSWSMFVFVVQ
jgi:hypothetical protein